MPTRLASTARVRRRRPVRRAAALATGLALLAAACGSEAERSTGAGPVAAALAVVPAGEAPVHATVADVGRVLALDGVARPASAETGPAADAYARALVTGKGRALPLGQAIGVLRRPDAMAAELGFSLHDVERWVEAGTPPDTVVAATGRMTADAIVAAATTFEPFAATAQRSQRDGFEVLRFGPDDTFDRDAVTPWRTIGTGGRLAARDGLVLWATNDRTIDAAVDAAAGRGSVLDAPGVRAVVAGLDRHPVYSAVLTGGSVEVDWIAAGLGAFDAPDGARRAVVALAYADADGAAAGADTLRRLVAEGRSLRTQQPWAASLDLLDVAVDGATVVAVLDTRGTDVLFGAVAARDFVWAAR